jgi:Mitochondrial carrier protein
MSGRFTTSITSESNLTLPSVGAVLYTTYLQTLGALHEPSSMTARRVYPPPDPAHTLTAGFAAGAVQSVVAAPLDALQARFKANEMLEGRYKSIWHYSLQKLHEIGLRGIFAGWTMSFVKDSLSCAVFFSTFEYTKGQLYYASLPRFYDPGHTREIPFQAPLRPHYLLEPAFILAAGAFASFAQQAVQQPLTLIQNIHYARLESLDYAAKIEKSHSGMMRLYYHAYLKTFDQAKQQALRAGGWRKLLYKDFAWNTIRQTPSTSAGLIAFEILRRKYSSDEGQRTVRLDGVPFAL